MTQRNTLPSREESFQDGQKLKRKKITKRRTNPPDDEEKMGWNGDGPPAGDDRS